MRVRLVAVICDKCGNRVPEDREQNVTTVGLAGPDTGVNGSYDICEDCIDGVQDALGVAFPAARPSAKRAPKPKPVKGGGRPRTNWTHLEMDEVMRGMAEGLDADQIAAKLPGRTAKAVMVRMGRIRKGMAATPVNLEKS